MVLIKSPRGGAAFALEEELEEGEAAEGEEGEAAAEGEEGEGAEEGAGEGEE